MSELVKVNAEEILRKLETELEWTKTHGKDERFREGRVSGLLTAIRFLKEGANKNE